MPLPAASGQKRVQQEPNEQRGTDEHDETAHQKNRETLMRKADECIWLYTSETVNWKTTALRPATN